MNRSSLLQPGPRRRKWRMRRPPGDRALARGRLLVCSRRYRAKHAPPPPDRWAAGRWERGAGALPRGRAAAAGSPAALDGENAATRTPRHESSRKISNDLRSAGASLSQLRDVTDARRSKMRTPPAFPARCGRDGIGDLTRLDALGDQIVCDGHMNSGPLARREQDGNSALMLRAEAIHDGRDLVAVVDTRLGKVQLQIANALDVSRFPCPGFQELRNALLQLLVLFQHGLDATRQVLGLRLEQPGSLGQAVLGLERVAVRRGTGERFDASHARGGASLVREAKQCDLTRRADMGSPAQLERDARNVHDAHHVAVF